MRISHCINCGIYKYIENKGMCRSCLSNKNLNIGQDKNGNINSINPKLLYGGLSITGDVASGKSTMAVHLIKQLYDMNYGIIYFDNKRDILGNVIGLNNFKTIDFGDGDGFNIMKINRNKSDKHYNSEITLTTGVVKHLIYSNTNDIISFTNKMILDAVVKSILYLNKEYNIKEVYECLTDLDKRDKLFSNSNYSLPNKNYKLSYIENQKLDSDDSIVSSLYNLIYNKKLMDSISKIGSSMKIKDIIDNSETVICRQDKIKTANNQRIIGTFVSEKLFNEIALQNQSSNKKDFVFCYDNINKIGDIREKMIKNGRVHNIGVINIINSIMNSNKDSFKYSNNIMSFRISKPSNIANIHKRLGVNISELSQLYNYKYISNIDNTEYRGKIDL
jgi:GTPase SAR1 family protein